MVKTILINGKEISLTDNLTLDSGTINNLLATVDVNSGSLNVFIYGPGSPNGRIGADWKSPFECVIPALPVGSYSLKVEHYMSASNHSLVEIKVNVQNASHKITGILFNDSDGDGVFDAGETPTGQRDVILLDANNTILKTVQSNSQGVFVFDSLKDGTYKITRNFPSGYVISNPTKPNTNYVEVTLAANDANIKVGTKTVAPVPLPSSSTSTPPMPSSTSSTSSSNTLWGVCDLHYSWISQVPNTFSELKPAVNRVWRSPNGFATFDKLGDTMIQAIKTYGAIKSIPIFCISDQPTKVSGDVAKWFISLIDTIIVECNKDPKTKDMPIWIEAGNEPDLEPDHYWIGDITSYINQYLKPCYEAVKAKYGDRVKICTAGFSWNADLLIQNINQLAKYSDAIGYHGYLTSLSMLDRYTKVKAAAISVNKPVWLTELALGYGLLIKREPDPVKKEQIRKQWSLDTPALIEHLKNIKIDVVCYYEVVNVNGTTNAGAALLTDTLQKTPFFDAYLKNQ